MARKPRMDPDGGWHHVMNRGVDHTDIFIDAHDRRSFLRLVDQASTNHGIEVVAYCLVGNHFHLIVHCPHGGLSPAMKELGASHAQRFNHRHGRDGALYRGRFASKVIGDDRYLRHVIAYVHRNSFDLGVDPIAWPWSSCQHYLGIRRPPDWLHVSTALHLIGGVEEHRHDVTQPATQTDTRFSPAELEQAWRQSWTGDAIRRIRSEVHALPTLTTRQRRDAVRLIAFDHAGLRLADALDVLDAKSTGSLRTQTARARRRAIDDSQLASAVRRTAEALGWRRANAA